MNIKTTHTHTYTHIHTLTGTEKNRRVLCKILFKVLFKKKIQTNFAQTKQKVAATELFSFTGQLTKLYFLQSLI